MTDNARTASDPAPRTLSEKVWDRHVVHAGTADEPDVVFIDRGRIALDCSIEDIAARYAAVAVTEDRAAAAREAAPFYERRTLGKTVLYFENPDVARLKALGEVSTPSVADLFVAKLSRSAA